jgi:putative transposase
LFPERQKLVLWFDETVQAGSRKAPACAELGLTLRTVQRWREDDELRTDARTTVSKAPCNKLTESERAAILAMCNNAPYASLPPSQIVPRLADEHIYLASESTFYRVLNSAAQGYRRGRAQSPRKVATPTSHCASGPNQVWSWDITYLPSTVCGRFWYLYLFEDIFSRKAVGGEVYEEESGLHAANLLQHCVRMECAGKNQLVLHSDNGAPMKSSTMLAKMYELGVTSSRGRPRVSNDNPYSESLFRTLKYCPQWPAAGFATLQAARDWVGRFIEWYNHEHRHSRIRFVTPEQRHCGNDKSILAARHAVYETAKANRPERWSGATRNWQPMGDVMLNPEKLIAAHAA